MPCRISTQPSYHRSPEPALPSLVPVAPSQPGTFSLVSLLLHDVDVPASARAALREALAAPEEHRRDWLEAAAFALSREAHLDEDDARELVGLDD